MAKNDEMSKKLWDLAVEVTGIASEKNVGLNSLDDQPRKLEKNETEEKAE